MSNKPEDYLTEKQIEKCVAMVESGEYVTLNGESMKKNFGDDMILMKYLMLTGKDRDEIYDIWEKIYENTYGKDDGLFKTLTFERSLKRAENMKPLPKRHACIYQDEIDKINSIDTKFKWIKEVAFFCLIYCKLSGKTTFDFPIHVNLMKYTSIPSRHIGKAKTSASVLIESKLMSIYEDNKWDYFEGEWYVEEKYVFDVDVKKRNVSEKPVCKVYKIEDGKEYLDLIKCTRICECCGKEYNINGKTQRNICEECWKKEQVKKAINRRERYFLK